MDPKKASWIAMARQQADQFSNKPAYVFLEYGERPGETITYAEIDRHARALAARLQATYKSGERVLLVYDSCIQNMIGFFGCLYAGMIAVPVCPPHRNRRNARIQNIIADCAPQLALSTSKQMEETRRQLAGDPLIEGLAWESTDLIDPEMADAWTDPNAGHATLAFLQYTSGSTGLPKGAMVTHGNLLHNQAMLQSAFETTPDSTCVSWLPIFHDMGLIGQMLHAFYVGATCVFMSPMSFLQQPARWLHAITKYKADISGGPNFSYSLCEQKIPEDTLAEFNLSSWRVALNGAEPVKRDTLESFHRRFARCGFSKSAFCPGYGMAEATLIITGSSPSEEPAYRWVDKKELRKERIVTTAPSDPMAQPIAACGDSILDETIVIVDPETMQLCPDDQIGEIWVAGQHVTQGYWNRQEETQNTFQAFLSDGRGPFLRTGDLGFLKAGALFITGRLKDIIIIQGSKHYPQDIESTIQTLVPAVCRQGIVAVGISCNTGEEVVVIAELEREMVRKGNLAEIAASIRRVVSQEHGLVLQDVVLISPGALPKTTSGKVQRRLCAALYLAQGFEACHRAAFSESGLLAIAS